MCGSWVETPRGVRLIRLVEGEKLVEIERIELLAEIADDPVDDTE